MDDAPVCVCLCWCVLVSMHVCVSEWLCASVIDGLCGGPFTVRCLLISLNDWTSLMRGIDENGIVGPGYGGKTLWNKKHPADILSTSGFEEIITVNNKSLYVCVCVCMGATDYCRCSPMCQLSLASRWQGWRSFHEQLYREVCVDFPSPVFSSSVCVSIHLSPSSLCDATHPPRAQSGCLHSFSSNWGAADQPVWYLYLKKEKECKQDAED